MKVGSLVECIKQITWHDSIHGKSFEGPAKSDIDMVTGFDEFIGLKFITLERFGITRFRIDFFREIEFPPSFEKELNEVIEEVINQPLEV